MTRSGGVRRLPRRVTRPLTAAAMTAAAFALLGASPAAAASAQGTQAPANAVDGGSSGIVETLIGGALLLFAVAGLTLMLRWRSQSSGANRRTPAHTRAAGSGGAQRDLAREPLAPTMHHDPYPQRPAPAVPPARGRHVRVPGGYSGYPGPGVPAVDPPEHWSARLARNTAPIPQTYYDLAFGDAPSREGAEREAAEIRQLVEAQGTAIREAAEQEAAELRAHLAAMAAEMARVAAYVTESLTSPGLPAVPPPRQAGPRTLSTPVELPVEPGAGPAVQPAARPATAPRTRPRAGPATKPAARPGAKPKTRQYKAIRVTSVATAALVVFAAVAGSTEIGLHGFKFFVFRSAGTGATNGDGLQENQGPGQPDAPGAHHEAQHQQAAKAKSHGQAHQRHGKAHQRHGQAHQQHGKAHQAKPPKKN